MTRLRADLDAKSALYHDADPNNDRNRAARKWVAAAPCATPRPRTSRCAYTSRGRDGDTDSWPRSRRAARVDPMVALRDLGLRQGDPQQRARLVDDRAEVAGERPAGDCRDGGDAQHRVGAEGSVGDCRARLVSSGMVPELGLPPAAARRCGQVPIED